MFGKIWTAALDTVRMSGRLTGTELAVIVTPHNIKLRMFNPESHSKYADSKLYQKGNLYLEGFANPVKLKYPETEGEAREDMEVELVTSKRYAEKMDESLINDIINEGSDSGLTLRWAVLMIIASVMLSTSAILVAIMWL